jgi:hypothetical protein
VKFDQDESREQIRSEALPYLARELFADLQQKMEDTVVGNEDLWPEKNMVEMSLVGVMLRARPKGTVQPEGEGVSKVTFKLAPKSEAEPAVSLNGSPRGRSDPHRKVVRRFGPPRRR